MANEKINLNNCTKEQIINVVKAAKERKLAWEKRVQSEMRMRQAVGNSFKKALKELEDAEKSELDDLPDASTLFAPEKSNKVSEYEKDLCFTSTFDA